MLGHCQLVILLVALTLNGTVHTGEIIGGDEAVAHSRPYMVFLERHMSDGTIAYCGGFLVTQDWVMTAAHCQAREFKVSLGVHNARNPNGGQTSYVQQMTPHYDFNVKNYKNDIMLLKISPKAIFSDTVRPIDFAFKEKDYPPKNCSVSGWGRTEHSKHLSSILREANVTLKRCCVRDTSYCSGGQTGPAKGDSGGPLVCEDGKAYGVVSTHFNGSDIYTKIPKYISWIVSVIYDA